MDVLSKIEKMFDGTSYDITEIFLEEEEIKELQCMADWLMSIDIEPNFDGGQYNGVPIRRKE